MKTKYLAKAAVKPFLDKVARMRELGLIPKLRTLLGFCIDEDRPFLSVFSSVSIIWSFWLAVACLIPNAAIQDAAVYSAGPIGVYFVSQLMWLFTISNEDVSEKYREKPPLYLYFLYPGLVHVFVLISLLVWGNSLTMSLGLGAMFGILATAALALVKFSLEFVRETVRPKIKSSYNNLVEVAEDLEQTDLLKATHGGAMSVVDVEEEVCFDLTACPEQESKESLKTEEVKA